MSLDKSLRVIDAAMRGVEDEAQLVIGTKCRALMTCYDRRWRFDKWSAKSLEETVHLPIVNPATGRTSRTWTQAGKHDGVISGYGRRLLLEHKTCSEDIEDPAATYWRRLDIDSQVSQYVLQHWQAGGKLDGTLYDVIRKPASRPKKITAAVLTSIHATNEYYGQKVSEETKSDLAEFGPRENQELYFHRLCQDMVDRSNRYFQRKVIHRTDGEVVEFASELWDLGQTIADANRDGRHYRNSAACLTYGSPCEYLGVCSGHDTLESDKWERASRVHAELSDDFGGNVLTNSRAKCFQLCRRKHHYRYGLGIRRRDEEGTEALYFGSLMHQSLEAWWSAYLEGTENDKRDEAGGGQLLP